MVSILAFSSDMMADGLLSGETCPNFSVGSHRYALRKKLTNDYPSALLKSLLVSLQRYDRTQEDRYFSKGAAWEQLFFISAQVSADL